MTPRGMDPARVRSPLTLKPWLALGFAAVLTWLAGVRAPFIPRWSTVPLGLGLGHLAFFTSVLVTRLSLREARVAFQVSLRLLYLPYGFGTGLFYLVVALAEELLFRVLPVELWGPGPGVAALFVAGFALTHSLRPGRRGLPVLQLLDMTLFAAGTYAVYLATGDLWALVLIHWVRNLSVAKTFVRKDRLETTRSAGVGPSDG